MIIIDGKTYYRLFEVSQMFGYSESEIMRIIKDGKCDAENISGEWLITDPGMVALKRMRMAKTPVVKPKQKTHTPAGAKEGQMYIRTKEDQEAYETIKRAAAIAKIPVGDITMRAVRYYVLGVVNQTIRSLELNETSKIQLISKLRGE